MNISHQLTKNYGFTSYPKPNHDVRDGTASSCTSIVYLKSQNPTISFSPFLSILRFREWE